MHDPGKMRLMLPDIVHILVILIVHTTFTLPYLHIFILCAYRWFYRFFKDKSLQASIQTNNNNIITWLKLRTYLRYEFGYS